MHMNSHNSLNLLKNIQMVLLVGVLHTHHNYLQIRTFPHDVTKLSYNYELSQSYGQKCVATFPGCTSLDIHLARTTTMTLGNSDILAY